MRGFYGRSGHSPSFWINEWRETVTRVPWLVKRGEEEQPRVGVAVRALRRWEVNSSCYPHPLFCVSAEMIGVTGGWSVCAGIIGVRGAVESSKKGKRAETRARKIWGEYASKRTHD
jgi:hypothetical protein